MEELSGLCRKGELEGREKIVYYNENDEQHQEEEEEEFRKGNMKKER